MDTDDLEPLKPKSLEPAQLDGMSIEALTEYIAEREAEIERARAMIEKKQAAKQAAASVFKT